MGRPKSALILGGGLAGLTCADELARAGVQVTILEQQDAVGGLIRNVSLHGATFDLGGHRFFTEKPALLRWLRELVGDRLREVPRKSRILLGGRYFDYPLRPFNALGGFGLVRAAAIIGDYLGAAVRRHLSHASDLSLEDWVVQRYGRKLFDIYFGPYSEKVWGVPCDEISAEWAAQRIQLMSLADAVYRAVIPTRQPKTYSAEFHYPVGGIGVLADTLAERVRGRGGRILTGQTVDGLALVDGRVTGAVVGDRTHDAEVVIGTVPLTRLGAWLGAPPAALARLSFRALRCVFLVIDMPRVTDDTWLYFSEPEILFGRLHEPRNWDPGMAPPGQTSLCLEIFCDEGDARWRQDEAALVDECARELDRLGLVGYDRVIAGAARHVPNAYPVFRVGYRQPLREVLDAVAAIENLHVVGRTGAYRYENMDQVAESSLALAAELVQR